MTVNLSIKGVPEALAEQLRARAERHHRSLQGELMSIIEQAVQEPAAAGHLGPGLALRQDLAAVRRGHKRVEQLAAEHLARHPRPLSGVLPRAVDIIRAERDGR